MRRPASFSRHQNKCKALVATCALPESRHCCLQKKFKRPEVNGTSGGPIKVSLPKISLQGGPVLQAPKVVAQVFYIL